MRYDAAQVDRLAAEYVLGTLRGPARRRFDRLIGDRADVRFAVWRWESHLNGLAAGVKPIKPPRRVWQNIRRRIDASPARSASWWRAFWLAVPTAAAAAWLAVTFLIPSVPHVAVFADQDAATLWVISADLDRGVLRADAVNAPTPDPNTVFELWVLPTGAPPLSLGLLPLGADSIESALPAAQLAALAESGALAISVEPPGGSPTGLPTGPVVYQATLVAI